MDATWHSGPRGSATRTRAAAYVASRYIVYIYLFNLYKRKEVEVEETAAAESESKHDLQDDFMPRVGRRWRRGEDASP